MCIGNTTFPCILKTSDSIRNRGIYGEAARLNYSCTLVCLRVAKSCLSLRRYLVSLGYKVA